MAFFRPTATGLELWVRLTPRGGADRIDGEVADAAGATRLAVRVRAVPEKGEANNALVRLVAKALGVPAGAVTVVSGHTSRTKTLTISGDPAVLADSAAKLAATSR
ncbi:MAG: DUF167 domain-containing protein [Rhizobiaceae bacterium]|nr:DUF167 domain-containing protein [Rhizobiaceae bacterium]